MRVLFVCNGRCDNLETVIASDVFQILVFSFRKSILLTDDTRT